MKKNRFIAWILAVVLVVGIFFCMNFITENAHHDCTGEKCPICLELVQAVHFISNIRFIPVLSYFVAVLSVYTLSRVVVQVLILHNRTLISQKVELII